MGAGDRREKRMPSVHDEEVLGNEAQKPDKEVCSVCPMAAP